MQISFDRPQLRTRSTMRYKLPLEAKLNYGGKDNYVTIDDISKFACKVQGYIKDILQHNNNPCEITFLLSKGYSKSLNQFLPQKPIQALITKTTLNHKTSKDVPYHIEVLNE